MKELTVEHVFSGKNHFFKVVSEDSEHDVLLHCSCDCEFMSTSGLTKGKMCSHIKAVMKSICEVRGGDVVERKKERMLELGKGE